MRAVAVLLLLGTLALAGCGSAPPPKPGPVVHLSLIGPIDNSRTPAATVTVHGTVSPARATVLVLGRAVHVARNGAFSTSVHLADGANLIDVIASVPRSAGAMTAVRLNRFLLVTVPSVSGESPTAAQTALTALGLTVKIDQSSDPLAFLLPFSTHVCSTIPAAGSRVDPGSQVTLHTSKICFSNASDQSSSGMTGATTSADSSSSSTTVGTAGPAIGTGNGGDGFGFGKGGHKRVKQHGRGLGT